MIIVAVTLLSPFT